MKNVYKIKVHEYILQSDDRILNFPVNSNLELHQSSFTLQSIFSPFNLLVYELVKEIKSYKSYIVKTKDIKVEIKLTGNKNTVFFDEIFLKESQSVVRKVFFRS